jgi:hypothetical protein
MDFYIDSEGKIANEFYRIDEEGNLVKVESGIRLLKDQYLIEKTFS